MRRIAVLIAEMIATFFYVGRAPKAPGTLGSIAAMPAAWFLWLLPSPLAWGIACGTFFLGVWAAKSIIAHTGVQDHQSIVIDEVCGVFLVTSIAPHHWFWYFLSFILFRIFDIWKPWPVRWVDQKWKGGIGAMMDDIVAAMMAALVLFAFLYAARSFSPLMPINA